VSDLFPELDDRSSRGPAVQDDGDRDRPVVRLALGPDHKALAGSDWAREKFRQLLGLPPSGGDVPTIDGVRLMLGDGRIEIGIRGGPFDSVLLRLTPCKPSRSNPTNFRVMLQGPVKNEAVRQLIERVQRRLHRAPYRLLVKAVRADPAAELQTVAAVSAYCSTEEEFDRSVVRTHGGSSAWRVFFANLEQQRNFNHHVAGNILVLKHEDLECCYATPCLNDGTISFFNYSVSHRQGREEPALSPEAYLPPPEAPAERRQRREEQPIEHWGDVATDLTDVDVIKGGTRKLEGILDALAERPDKPDLVLVKMACVAKIIGDDLSEAMARFEERTGVPTVFLDNLADESNDFFSTLLERLRWEPDFLEPAERAGRINLVGFPDVPEMDRFVRVLGKLGITVNARLVPEVRLEDMKRYTWAELQVLVDSRLYYGSYEQLFGNVDIPSLRTTPPFGVAGSRAWLEAVAAELGRADGLAASWEAEWAPLADSWQRMCEKARGHRLGFVVDQPAMELLLSPEKGTGVPMLAMLAEMGFGLEFLVYTGDGTKPDPRLPGLVRPFRDVATLEELLRASAADAFYSEFYFDRRLSRTGKAQFSISDFQLGLEGAIWTLNRLLRICSLSYYRRYAVFLGRPFGPARHEAMASSPG
jgi:hypothetical protein